MIALIDADILTYRIGFAVQSKVWLVNTNSGCVQINDKKELEEYNADEVEEIIMVSSPSSAYHSIDVNIRNITSNAKCSSYKLFLTGRDNFRKKVDPEYKANRKNAPRPLMANELRNYMVDKYDAEVINGMEADDAIGINAVGKYCVCTVDKDLDQIPGWHFNWVKDIRYYIDEDYALRFKYIQLLTGDQTDNIKGIYKLGEKTAFKILENCQSEKEMQQAVKQEYLKEFGSAWESKYSVNEKLITILRTPV